MRHMLSRLFAVVDDDVVVVLACGLLVCACMCKRERARERARVRERERCGTSLLSRLLALQTLDDTDHDTDVPHLCFS